MPQSISSQDARRLALARDKRQSEAEQLARQREIAAAKRIRAETGCTWTEALRAALIEQQRVQVSEDGQTVWVHADDGSTVGRFSKTFGLDVHTTASDQMAGHGQCLHCTHEPAGPAEWVRFCALMKQHHGISVDRGLIEFERPQVVEAVARAFLRGMHDTVGESDLREIDLRNAAETHPGICHTHDFCDANVVMAEAMQEVTGVVVDPTDEGQLTLFNDSWNLARKLMPDFVRSLGEKPPAERPAGG